jgi:hypothetical protein
MTERQVSHRLAPFKILLAKSAAAPRCDNRGVPVTPKAATQPRGNASGVIGTLAETALHDALKRRYAGPEGEVEVKIGTYWIDARRADGALVEIQTGAFAPLKTKFAALLATHRICLVYPVPYEQRIVWLNESGEIERERRSPKRGRVEAIFKPLTAFPGLIVHDNLSIEVALTREIAIRRPVEKRRRWARGWTPVNRQLVDVVATHRFDTASDFAALLPETLPAAFTTADLSAQCRIPAALAGQMAYCLRLMAVLDALGRRGRAYVYARRDALA